MNTPMTSTARASDERRVPTLRELVAPIFRFKGSGLAVAGLVIALTLVLIALTPRMYEAEMKFLVKRDRADVIVTSGASPATPGRSDVTEDEINSEVEVLKGQDLLSQVAVAAGLAPDSAPANAVALETAVRSLSRKLRISPIRRTTLIQASYSSTDPDQTVRVLEQLSKAYLEKHLALHRLPGAYEFFSEQAARFKDELSQAEAKLLEYSQNQQVVLAEVERESTLRQLAEFEASLQTSQAQVTDATRRIEELVSQEASTPTRETTQVKTSDNVALTTELKSRVLTLETRRADMLRKFTPTYPPVIELEGQLAQAREALARTEQSPMTEATTDQNPLYTWVRGELARVRTERSAAIARVEALNRSISLYRAKARDLDGKAAVQEDLKRARRTAEENYLLYSKKQEEARISDALDRNRIANVVVAEPPIKPTIPSARGRGVMLVVGMFLALLSGLATVYLRAYISPYVHGPDDVEEALGVPLLASLSRR
jgi:uncharacterized protein involved in exopolysaccharide biosynthesis